MPIATGCADKRGIGYKDISYKVNCQSSLLNGSVLENTRSASHLKIVDDLKIDRAGLSKRAMGAPFPAECND